MTQKEKRGFRLLKIWILLLALAVLLVGTMVLLYQSVHDLTRTKYETYSNIIESSVRVVQISDLHNSEFGEDNHKLISMVTEQNPDLILILVIS